MLYIAICKFRMIEFNYKSGGIFNDSQKAFRYMYNCCNVIINICLCICVLRYIIKLTDKKKYTCFARCDTFNTDFKKYKTKIHKGMPINSVIVDDGWGNDNIGVSDIYIDYFVYFDLR